MWCLSWLRNVNFWLHDINTVYNFTGFAQLLCSFLIYAAQKDPAIAGAQVTMDQKQAFTGLLDGTGEYTLVYEDNEGDRMLVGDVPWE